MVAKRDPDAQLVDVRMPRELRERIDAFRSADRLPSRAESIRRLIEAGLEATEAAPNKRRS
jgi:Arc/MetJ-type ribon-helix-helix transcriptional regulator